MWEKQLVECLTRMGVWPSSSNSCPWEEQGSLNDLSLDSSVWYLGNKLPLHYFIQSHLSSHRVSVQAFTPLFARPLIGSLSCKLADLYALLEGLLLFFLPIQILHCKDWFTFFKSSLESPSPRPFFLLKTYGTFEFLLLTRLFLKLLLFCIIKFCYYYCHCPYVSLNFLFYTLPIPYNILLYTNFTDI